MPFHKDRIGQARKFEYQGSIGRVFKRSTTVKASWVIYGSRILRRACHLDKRLSFFTPLDKLIVAVMVSLVSTEIPTAADNEIKTMYVVSPP